MPKHITTEAIAYDKKGEHDKAYCRLYRRDPARPEIRQRLLRPGRCLRVQGRRTTRRLPTVPRLSASTRNVPKPIMAAACAYVEQGRARQGDRRLHRGHSPGPEVHLGVLQSGAMPTDARASTTNRLPIAPRPFGWTRKFVLALLQPWCRLRWTRANTTRRLPTARKPSGSTRKMPRRIANRGMAYGNKGEYDKAIADYTEAIRLDPKFAVGIFQPWHRPMGTRANTTRRLPITRRPSGLIPKSAEAYCNRGVVYDVKANYDKAIADYTEAIRLDPKVCRGVLTTAVSPTWNKGEYDKAIADFTEAIRLNPKDPGAYNNRGSAYERKGEYEKSHWRVARKPFASTRNMPKRIAIGVSPTKRRARRPRPKRISLRPRS